MKLMKSFSFALLALCSLGLLSHFSGLLLPDWLVRTLGVIALLSVAAFSFCWGRGRMQKN